MSFLSQKLMATAATATASGAVNVEDVFGIQLRTSTGAVANVTNSIDNSGEGGLVWTKSRSNAFWNVLYDTERGGSYSLTSNNTNSQRTNIAGAVTFNNNGYSIAAGYGENNASGYTYVDWNFKKSPKFFDIIEYTGNGSAQVLNHALDGAVGLVIIKRTDATGDWTVGHRSNYISYQLKLNSTAAGTGNGTFGAYWTDTTIQVEQHSSSNANVTGGSYVAYLFADNSSEDAENQMIKCGSYVGNSSNDGQEINLGFEPQWILLKKSTGAHNWLIYDKMRGINEGSAGDPFLMANDTGVDDYRDWIKLTPTGFKFETLDQEVNSSSHTYIYMAIRNDMMKEITDATKLFAMDLTGSSEAAGTQKTTGFPVDFQLVKLTSGSHTYAMDRLRGASSTTTESGPYLYTSSATDEAGTSFTRKWDNTGYQITSNFGNNPYMFWNWKRAKSFFDCVIWQVDGTGDQTINHNLGVAPEMVISKNRNDSGNNSGDWWVGHTGMTGWSGSNPNDRHAIKFNKNAASAQQGYHWDFSDASIQMKGTAAGGYTTSHSVIAYLFATLAGVSKVGSVAHSGTSTDVDCGFSAGARFVMLKRTDATGDWYFWDSVRGIVAGNDPYFLLNANAAQVTNTDYIDPLASGFQISGDFTDGDYIFYAIA